MRLFLFCSDMIIPVIILGIVCYGVTQHVDVYESLIKGANSGFQTVIKIMPTMLALMIAVGILRASGLLETIGMWIGSMTDHIGFPGELVPLTVVRMFSSSAAVSLLLDIFKQYGADSAAGLMGAVIMSATESVFYCMSVYFGSVKIEKTRYTLPGALLATTAGAVTAIVLVRLM